VGRNLVVAALHRFVISAADRSPVVFIAALTLAAFVVRIAAAPFGVPLLLDPFAYARKAIEISQGSFQPIESHAIGWSLVLTPFLAPFTHADPITVMNAARVVACAVGALVVVPTAIIARETLDASARPWPPIAAVVAEPLVRVSAAAFAEPLLTLTLTASVAAMLVARRVAPRRVQKDQAYAALTVGAVFAGASMWVHATGVMALAIAVGVLVSIAGIRSALPRSAYALIVAILVAAPAAGQRALAFGGPFAFGQNTRFFADRADDLWIADAPNRGALDYIRTHSAGEIADRLLLRGAGRELGHFAVSVVHLPVLPFFLIGCAVAARDPRLRPVLVAVAIFLAAWVPVYDLFGVGRHLAPALPFALVLSAAGLAGFAGRSSRAAWWTMTALLAFIVGETAVGQIQRREELDGPRRDGMVWGRWIAEHVRGRVAIVEGQELVMMFVPDAVVAGADINAMRAPTSGLELVRPRPFGSTSDAAAWLRSHGITHVLLDRRDPNAEWIEKLHADGEAQHVRLVERFATPIESRWPVRVFEAQWRR